MNFQQLKSVAEAVRFGYNLTEVAKNLNTSQPGVSRQILELEDELGIDLFTRSGKRLTGLSNAGVGLLPIIEQILVGARNLKRGGEDLQNLNEGTLSVGATHTQARYVLPHVVRDFRERYPNVSLHLHQGSPTQIAEMITQGVVDIGIATEVLAQKKNVIVLDSYRWTHSVVVPREHKLTKTKELALEDLASYPIVTYQDGFTGRAHIDKAFKAASVEPNIVLTAMDADVIKTYVELGLGVGIIASVAWDDDKDRSLALLDAGHLFPLNTTRIGFSSSHWLTGFALGFIETFVPTLTREKIMEETRRQTQNKNHISQREYLNGHL
ncbi:MAG: CysB family HTH-type transcriptional regulator [Burkholderiaceae bacterium]